jgi:hypothetical protein
LLLDFCSAQFVFGNRARSVSLPKKWWEKLMGDAEYYREQSEFCAYMSDVARRPEDKARWLKLAAQWRELAEATEHRGQAHAE